MKEHFTDTIFYQIELTARYCKLLGAQVFEQLNVGFSVEEYSILDTLLAHRELCQRDLAKLILKDRANTGKLLDGLEKKGLLTRKLSIKNNRPVKIIEITEEGRKQAEEASQKIRPQYVAVKEPACYYITDSLIHVTAQAGTGRSTNWGFFYDYAANKRSATLQ